MSKITGWITVIQFVISPIVIVATGYLLFRIRSKSDNEKEQWNQIRQNEKDIAVNCNRIYTLEKKRK